MNERIKEIAKQAGAYWQHGDFNMGSSVEFQEEDLEKFAELIVRECFDVVIADGRFHDARRVIRAGKSVALEHFGVEE